MFKEEFVTRKVQPTLEEKMAESESVEDKLGRKLKILLARENPPKFNLRWIRERDRTLADQIERNCFEIIDGRKDYSDFIATLGLEWAERFSYFERKVEKDRTFESCMQEIITKVTIENPSRITPGWIDQHCSARFFIHKNLRMPNGDITWDIIPDFLPPELRHKWHNDDRRMHHQDLFAMGKALEEKLAALNPETFNVRWINKQAGNVSSWVNRYIRHNNKPDFLRFILTTLSPHWRLRFRWPELQSLASAITEKLEALKPETFNARWIQQNAPALHHKARSIRNPDDNTPYWELIVSCLPVNWQERWRQGFRDESLRKKSEAMRKYTFESALERLNQLLKQTNLRIISSKTIERLAPDIYDHFSLYVRNQENEIDWDRIIKALDDELKLKFVKPKRFKDLFPKKQYEDNNSVEELFTNKYKAKLYTLVLASTDEDRQWRDTIYHELITLAKSGNLSAENKIISYVNLLVNEWIDNDKELAAYKYATEELNSTIRRCIYFYDEIYKVSFINFVHATLKKKVPSMREKIKEVPFY